jgi:hypothetical protein
MQGWKEKQSASPQYLPALAGTTQPDTASPINLHDYSLGVFSSYLLSMLLKVDNRGCTQNMVKDHAVLSNRNRCTIAYRVVADVG